jgi:ActR/RegA family two-component response regulator
MMTTVSANALVVEDEPSWSEVYQRALRRVGVDRVEATDTYEGAATAIDAMRFAVAVVDIGLAVDDDTNVDGLRVMEKIRKVGDSTSIIVVTGRSGRDVVSIIRDSLKKFGAYDTIAKNTLVPAELRGLIDGGLDKFRHAHGDDKKQLYAALRGKTDPLVWDDIMLRGAAVGGGGAEELYRLVEGLLGRFVPLVPSGGGGVRMLDDVASGAFWSRGTGEPIVACFGTAKQVDEAIEMAGASGLLFGRYRVRDVSSKYRTDSAKGVVWRLADHHRSDFG